jgi:UDP-3-O-[3-hydroxymyristoyl] glucosamine N-acyltransferase
VAHTLAELAARVGGEVAGDPRREITGVRTLRSAGPEHLAFLSGNRYLEEARATRAGAVLIARRRADLCCDQLVTDNVPLALARLLELFHPPIPPAAGIHPTAVVAAGARVDSAAHVGPYVVIGDEVEIGPGAALHAHVVVGRGCRIGAGSVLRPHVVLYDGVRIGDGVEVHAGAVLGADGFGYAVEDGAPRKIPQVGGVVIGDQVEIGALTAIDRAVIDDTTIGSRTKIDNLVQVGHNSRVGSAVTISGQTGLAGSAHVADQAVIGGQVGINGHMTVGAGTQVAGQSLVISTTEPRAVVAGSPAVPIGSWRRQQAMLGRLTEIWRRLRRLERHTGLEAPAAKGEGER